MKATRAPFPRGVGCTTLCLIGLSVGTHAMAQRVSFDYELFPHVRLADPIAGSEEFTIRASSWRLGASFPLSFSRGAVMVFNDITYERTDFDYRNLPAGGPGIERVHAVELSIFMIDSLSTKWKMAAAVMPGLASDLEGPVSSDDFTFGAILGFVRQVSTAFQLGAGVAYLSDFGEPLPLPFLYVDWQTPRLRANAILPTSMVVAYRVNPTVDLGLSLRVDGTQYHGDPAKYGVANPRLKYSEGVISPSVQIHWAPWLHTSVEGGYAFYRNFEFFDGDQRTQSLDLRQTGYLRTSLVLGM